MSLSAIIFSRILPRHEVREIGRYDVVNFGSFPYLSNGLMSAILHRLSTLPFQHSLYICRRSSMAFGP